jgi:uncharacterized protein with FMN-binding domain
MLVLMCACALLLPVADAFATAKKRVTTVTKSVTSPVVDVSRWGQLEVVVKINVTTTTVGSKKTKTWKVTSVDFPIYPNHTDRSAYISQQALPMLKQEILQIKGNTLQIVSGATDTSYAFVQALRGALAKVGV